LRVAAQSTVENVENASADRRLFERQAPPQKASSEPDRARSFSFGAVQHGWRRRDSHRRNDNDGARPTRTRPTVRQACTTLSLPLPPRARSFLQTGAFSCKTSKTGKSAKGGSSPALHVSTLMTRGQLDDVLAALTFFENGTWSRPTPDAVVGQSSVGRSPARRGKRHSLRVCD